MHEQLKFLIELQEVDSLILSLAEKIDELPRQLDRFRAPLREAAAHYQKETSRHEALKKRKREKEQQLDEMQDRIEKLRAKSKDVKTNREYEAHLREIQGFEQHVQKIEDELLDIMEEIESFEKKMDGEKAELKKSEDEFRTQEAVLGEEQKKIKEQLETEKTRRKEHASRLSEENYGQYMNLMKRLGDRAVVEARDEICQGCHTNIPPQLYNDIRKNDNLYTCFYCKRFLYFRDTVSPDTQAPETAPPSL